MNWNQYPTGDIRKYKGLLKSEQVTMILHTLPDVFKNNCNGVGSPSGSWYSSLVYKITPNWIMFEDVTAFSDLHDNEYSFPTGFQTKEKALEHKAQADQFGYQNLLILCERMYERDLKRWWMPKSIARARKLAFIKWARAYKVILTASAEDIFLKDKQIG